MKKIILTIVAMSAMVGISVAADYDWTGSANGNWSETNNWVGLEQPSGQGNTDLYFTNDTINVATTNDTNTLLKRSDIVFGPNTNGSWSISGNDLLAGNLGNTSITLLDGAGAVIINSKVEFSADGKTHTLTIGGSDSLEFNGDFDNTTGGDVIFSGEKSASKVYLNGATTVIGGDWMLRKKGLLNLQNTGSMLFKIGTTGVNKKIYDPNLTVNTSKFNAEGTFIFDLTSAGTVVGDSWTIVDVNVATWDAFNVQDFTETPAGSGIWVDAAGAYQFTTTPSNGVLTVIGKSPAVLWNDWLGDYTLGSDTNYQDDADGDRVDNLSEYAFGGDPSDPGYQGNTPIQSQLSEGTNVIEYIYFERDDAANRGLVSILTVGTDLVNTNWADGSSYEVGRGSSDVSGYNAVTNWIPTDEEDQQFIRLQIELTP